MPLNTPFSYNALCIFTPPLPSYTIQLSTTCQPSSVTQRASGNSTSTGACTPSVASGTQKEGGLIYGSAFVPTNPLLELSHRMLDIGVMSRGDSFPSSPSIAPASSTPPSISSHMPCNPETHVILSLNPFGKEIPYRRRGSCNPPYRREILD